VWEVSSFFYTDTSVADFLNEVPVLKALAEESLLAFGPCSLEDRVYRERSSTEPPFFFMYSCLFADLHVSLAFDAFTAGVLKELNVASTQLHPNSWASMQAFHIVCKTFGLRPLTSCFLHFYVSHPVKLTGWQSLVSREGSVLFKPFTTSYKNFKEKFFKVYMEPAGMRDFFDEVCQSRFPLFWSRNPTKITDWPRPAYPSEQERLIFSLFDSLPKKLPARPLMSLYNATDRAEAFEGMLFDTYLFLFILLCLTGLLLFACRNRKERNTTSSWNVALLQEQTEQEEEGHEYQAPGRGKRPGGPLKEATSLAL